MLRCVPTTRTTADPGPQMTACIPPIRLAKGLSASFSEVRIYPDYELAEDIRDSLLTALWKACWGLIKFKMRFRNSCSAFEGDQHSVVSA